VGGVVGVGVAEEDYVDVGRGDEFFRVGGCFGRSAGDFAAAMCEGLGGGIAEVGGLEVGR
jgi:hypothetical protein